MKRKGKEVIDYVMEEGRREGGKRGRGRKGGDRIDIGMRGRGKGKRGEGRDSNGG